MVYLKEANTEDIEKEYEFITNCPENENGFINGGYGCSAEEFKNNILPIQINYSKGIGLKEGHVPETYFYLWDGDNIVGMFKMRHCLNEALKNGAGHIGYGIKKDCRGKGYATEGLKLVLEKAREIVKEDEIYMSVSKNNPASLRVQIKNGAYIHHEDKKEFYTRIRK